MRFSQKFVEYYDSRDCENAFKEAQKAEFNGGYFDIRHAFIQRKDQSKGKSKDSYRGTEVTTVDRLNHSDQSYDTSPTRPTSTVPLQLPVTSGPVDPQKLVLDQMNQFTQSLAQQSGQPYLTSTTAYVNPAFFTSALQSATSTPSIIPPAQQTVYASAALPQTSLNQSQ